MDEYKLETYWNDLPTEKEKAATYDDLKQWWGANERDVRKILHKLSSLDNGDDFATFRHKCRKNCCEIRQKAIY